jgi:hypothetical protein
MGEEHDYEEGMRLKSGVSSVSINKEVFGCLAM